MAQLQLVDFRCFTVIDMPLGQGLTVLSGANGQGKTSLLEAVGWVARGRSFRGVPDASLVRAGAAHAIVRAEIVAGERVQQLDAELRVSGRNRVLLNRNAVTRLRDLLGLVRVTVFSPDDLELVKGGPAERRTYLDELLTMLAPRYDAARSDFERVLRQRNALLRNGVRDPEARSTLDVFDEQLAVAGGELVHGRLRLVERLVPAVVAVYGGLAGHEADVGAHYQAEWSKDPLEGLVASEVADRLRAALLARRRAEAERGMTLVGPHRDDLVLTVGSLDARTQASQGEQRTLALALRLAGHELCSHLTGATPVLLLDDVFSELDNDRATALVERLPPGQTLLTTAGPVPAGMVVDHRYRVDNGAIERER